VSLPEDNSFLTIAIRTSDLTIAQGVDDDDDDEGDDDDGGCGGGYSHYRCVVVLYIFVY
jgi:hypothetical protein